MDSSSITFIFCIFFFSSRRRHTRFDCDWSSDVCSSDLGKGSKLIGDAVLNDLGIYANAIHPLNSEVKQNARFHISSKVYLPDRRGRFDIVARKDIEIGEEVIVDYGKFYWKACQDFKTYP